MPQTIELFSRKNNTNKCLPDEEVTKQLSSRLTLRDETQRRKQVLLVRLTETMLYKNWCTFIKTIKKTIFIEYKIEGVLLVKYLQQGPLHNNSGTKRKKRNYYPK